LARQHHGMVCKMAERRPYMVGHNVPEEESLVCL
jgi:hypothetical protein